jgi:uncharacterized membrane protein
MSRTERKWAIVAVIAAAIGLLDAVYLAASHYRGIAPECSLLNGCEQVTASVYATMFGVPIALFGALYYLFALVLLFLALEFGSRRAVLLLLGASSAAFLFSLWLVFAQLFLLKAVCLYCVLSALTSTIVFVSAVALFFTYRQRSKITQT